MLYGDIYRCAKFYSFKAFFMLEIHLKKYLLLGKSWEKKEENRLSVLSLFFVIIRLWSFYIYIYISLELGIIKDVGRKIIHEINREIREV